MADLYRALEDMDDMIEALERGDVIFLAADEGKRLLVLKQNALKQALSENDAMFQMLKDVYLESDTASHYPDIEGAVRADIDARLEAEGD